MSRTRRYIRSVGVGYISLAANVLYSLGTIPLALHYLTPAQFGLWALVSQIAWYLMLLDTGMSNATSRLLIDEKDHRNTGSYGSVLKTGSLVLGIQGFILFLTALLGAPLLSLAFKVPSNLTSIFTQLLVLQAAISSVSLAARGVGQLLIAHGRFDLFHVANIGYFVASFGVTWISFAAGANLFSLVYGAAAGVIVSTTMQLFLGWQQGFFPRQGEWGRITWERFSLIFSFGKDLFLITLGTNLMITTQPLIIARTLGLEAAAGWAIGTKVFTLMTQMALNLYQASGPIFGEMWTRGESDRMMRRSRDLLIVCLLACVACGCGLAIGNTAFVNLWTRGKILWSPVYDLLLAVWLCDLVANRVLSLPILVSKALRGLRFVYLLEGVVFVAAALWIVPATGITGLLVLSLTCSLISGVYLVWRNHALNPGAFRFWDQAAWTLPVGLMATLIAASVIVAIGTRSLPVQTQFLLRCGLLAIAIALVGVVSLRRFRLAIGKQ